MILSSSAHVNYLWDDAAAAARSPAERLVYRSNLLGSDQRITNTGGGNTSAKLMERDPLTGEPVEVLRVKGSGGDLRTSAHELEGLDDIRGVVRRSFAPSRFEPRDGRDWDSAYERFMRVVK